MSVDTRRLRTGLAVVPYPVGFRAARLLVERNARASRQSLSGLLSGWSATCTSATGRSATSSSSRPG